MRKIHCLVSLASLALLASTALAGEVKVYANTPVLGDQIVGTAGSGATVALTNAPGWFYNNVRTNSVAGINGGVPRSGNGSFSMLGESKADLEYYNFNTPGNALSGLKAMGTLDLLSGLSYDWLRSGLSTVAEHFHPSLRLMYDADGDFGTANDRGFLVFERIYNNVSTPADQWVTDDILNFNGMGMGANVWMTNTGNPNGTVLPIYDRTLFDWATSDNPNAAYPSLNKGAVIYGLNVGFGSGWNGTFSGAVDNVSIRFGEGPLTTYNFEVAPVPEPTTMAALALGTLGFVRRRRKA